MNSIQKHVGPLRPSDEAMLLKNNLEHSLQRLCVCVLAEGDSDKKLFEKVLYDESIIVIACGSKNAVERNVIEIKKRGTDGVVGIIDADFDRIRGITPADPSIILTDGHDLESTILMSGVLADLLHQVLPGTHGRHKKNIATSVFQDTIDCVKWIGYVRLASEFGKFQLGFGRVEKSKFVSPDGSIQWGFAKYVDPQNLSFDLDALITDCIGKKNTRCSHGGLKQAVQIHAGSNHDLFQLCRGHDLTAMLPLVIRKHLVDLGIGTGRFDEISTPSRIERITIEVMLQLAFDVKHFENTRIYAELCNWQIAHPQYQFMH